MKKMSTKKGMGLPVVTTDTVPLKKGETALVFHKGMKCSLATNPTDGPVSKGTLIATAVASMLKFGDDDFAYALDNELGRMVAFVTGMDAAMQEQANKSKPNKKVAAPKKRRGRPPKKEK